MDNDSKALEEFARSPLPEIRAEPVNVTPELIIANLTLGGSRVMKWPPDVLGKIRPGILDPHVLWPTMVMVTRIVLIVDPAPTDDPPQTVWSRVSLFGAGWQTGFPVSLKWNNAWGFPGTSIPLPTAAVDSAGFFAMDLVHKTVHRRHTDFLWEYLNQLVIVAQQKNQSGQIILTADERGIPPHVIWQWVP
jgi:hypothetical protein